MKAIRFHEHGGPEVLKYEDIPEPEPGPGECLVKVKATTLNGADAMTVAGIPGLTIPLPMIPGIDTAGEIAALGGGVDGSKWAVGDRVSVCGIIPVGEAFRLMGETLPGACCEYITVAQTNLLPIPDNVSYVQAAARLYMSLQDLSRLEFKAVIRRLSKSAKTFSMGFESTNYFQHGIQRLLGRQ